MVKRVPYTKEELEKKKKLMAKSDARDKREAANKGKIKNTKKPVVKKVGGLIKV